LEQNSGDRSGGEFSSVLDVNLLDGDSEAAFFSFPPTHSQLLDREASPSLSADDVAVSDPY
jgi:hypothetical protein